MGNVDDRVVAMSFDHKKFEQGVTKTLAALTKLNESLKHVGAANGLDQIQKSASKISFAQAVASAEKLKGKLNFSAEAQSFSTIGAAANKISFGPLTTAVDTIKGKLTNIANGPTAALDALKAKLGFPGGEKGLQNVEAASAKVHLSGANAAATALAAKLTFPQADKGFANIERAAGRVHLSSISSAIANVSNQFSVLQGAAAVALGSIVAKVGAAGASMAKSLTLGPVIDGLHEYQTNLNSIQTILANTQASGAKLKDVNAALQELNTYSDKTIYNFSEMAKNIGTFTAAGVDLKTSTASIKGIANLAALSGSNSQQASTAMYQLSQAISSGRVSLEDWNSVVNAGMGGTVFQRALAQTAQQMGTIKKGALELKGPMKNVTIAGQSFRESIQAKPGEKSWLTSKVLTNTLKQFTGDLSDAQLKAMGFNDEQIKSIQATAKSAQNAATQVKTLGQVFDVAKETIGSGWSSTFQTIFGDFEESKKLFTGLSNSVNGFINASSAGRNAVLKDWKDLGGRTALIDGIKNVFEDLGGVIKPIHEAFRDIFPAKTGKDLYNLTVRFRDFMKSLKIGPETADNLRRTFAGFFAVLDFGKQIVSGVFHTLGDLLGAAKDGSGGFLGFTASIGDFLVAADKAIKDSGALVQFFHVLGSVIAFPLKLIGDFAGALGSLFDGLGDTGGISSSLDDVTSSLSPMAKALKLIQGAWGAFVDVLDNAKHALSGVAKEIGSAFGGVGDAIFEAFQSLDFDKVFNIIQTTLIGGIFVIIKKALGGGIKLDLGSGLVDSMKETLGGLTGSLKAMQTSIKAGTLLKIAGAISLLAVGVVALSTIDPKKLTKAMTAVAIGLGQLVAAMAILTKVGGATSFLTMPFIAGSLILLAAAVDTLAIAVKVFSTMSWEGLLKGLAGVAGVLTAVAVGVNLMPKSLVLIGPALLPMAVALNIMALAVKIFSTLDWEELAKGLVGVAGALTAVGIGVKLMGPSILLVGPGLIAVAVALNLLAAATLAFGKMDLKTIGKGLLGIGGALVVIGAAIRLIPPTVILQAAGLALLAVALTGIAGAVALMGGMSMVHIAKGLAGIGAALVVLGVGLTGMTAAIPGSIALLGAATALAVLVPVLGILGTMKWSTIVKGLAAIAGILTVLGVAGTVAAPGLIALGLGLAALGAGITLIGGGVYLLTTGLSKLGSSGIKSIAALMAALTAMVALLPHIIIDFLKGLVDIAAGIAELAPKVVDSMVKIINSLLNVVIEAAPKMAEAVVAIMLAFVKVLNDSAGPLIEAGARLLLNLLLGIANNIGKVTETVAAIVINFLTALAASLPQIVASGVKMLVSLLGGIASNAPKLVAAAVDLVVKFTEAIAQNVGEVVEAGAKLIVKLLEGIGSNLEKVTKAAADMMGDFVEAAAKAVLGLTERIARIIINFINGLADAIRKYTPELQDAGFNLVDAIIDGALGGISKLGGRVISGLKHIFTGAVSGIGHALGIHSPSTVFAEIGKFMMLGAAEGVSGNAHHVYRSIENASAGIVDAMSSALKPVPDILAGMVDLDPVITPVLDLTKVQRDARLLGGLTNVTPITAAASYQQAIVISQAQRDSQEATDSTTQAPKEIKFEQTNVSPKALSEAEVYRNTKNLLSQAKKVLDDAA